MSQPIDWNKPIKTLPISGNRRLGRDYTAVRREQIRRAELLMKAAGSKQGVTANRIAALAEIVPGMRWTSGRLVYRGLAPEAADLMVPFIGDQARATRKRGRPTTWPADRKAALLERVNALKAESPREMTDAQALARIVKENIAHWRQRAEAAGRPFDREARRAAEDRIPGIERLENYLAEARAAVRAGEQ